MTVGVPEQIYGRDLENSVLWGVNLRRALFRDADLSGARFFHTFWSDVSIDGVVRNLVVNGVDVTDYVNSRDRWYPLRTQLEPTSAEALRSVWSALQAEWAICLGRIESMGPAAALTSVNGEWSPRDTLRHLVFAMDKWFSWPILGERTFSPLGLPNSESTAREWPGLDVDCVPTMQEVLAVRADRNERFSDHLQTIDLDALPETVDVPENGVMPTAMCFHAVLEEEFEHLRYTLRDLDIAARRDSLIPGDPHPES